MKTDDLRKDLVRDELMRSVARSRRSRRTRLLAAVLAPLCAIPFLMKSKPEDLGIVSVDNEEIEIEESYQTLSSEEDLMDHLAHLGPVIVTRDDGSQWLYLTKEEGE